MQPKMSRLHIHTAILSLLTAGKCTFKKKMKMKKIPSTSMSNICTILSPISGCVGADSTCRSRRCLAEMLIDKNYLSQPQYENCTQKIYVPFMEYQTLSVVSEASGGKRLQPDFSQECSLCRLFKKKPQKTQTCKNTSLQRPQLSDFMYFLIIQELKK